MRQVSATKRMNRKHTSGFMVHTVISMTLCLEWVKNRSKTDIEQEKPEEAHVLGS